MSWSFPILTINETIKCMTELHIPITDADLKDPQPAFIRGIYESFIEVLLGVKADEIQRQPQFEAMSRLEYPELHDESIAHLVMLAAMSRVFTACGIHDFTLKDVTKPETKRTVRNLSALINFAKFREEQLIRYQGFIAESDKLNEEKFRLEDANEAMAVKLHQLKQKRQAEAPLVQSITAETERMTVEINELNKAQVALQAEIRKIKDQMTEVADKVASDVFHIQTNQQDCNKLRGQIVQSPERIKREISEMGVTLEQERESQAAAERKARDLALRVELLDGTQTEIVRIIKAMEDALEQANKSRVAAREVEDLKDSIQQQQQQLKDLAAQEQQLKRQLTMITERLSGVTHKQELIRTAKMQQKEDLQREREAIQEQIAQETLRAEQMQAQCHIYREKMRSVKEQHEHEISDMRREFSHLTEQVSVYHTRLFQACQEAA